MSLAFTQLFLALLKSLKGIVNQIVCGLDFKLLKAMIHFLLDDTTQARYLFLLHDLINCSAQSALVSSILKRLLIYLCLHEPYLLIGSTNNLYWETNNL